MVEQIRRAERSAVPKSSGFMESSAALHFMAERPIVERQNLPLAPQMKLASALELLKPHVFMVTNSCPKLVS